MAGIITDTSKVSGVPQSASRHVAMSTCFDVYYSNPAGGAGSGGTILIGFLSQVSITNTRTVTQIRHLNSVDAGIAVDTVVTPDAPTLSFNGFYVYTNLASNQGLDPDDTGVAISAGQIGVGPTISRVAGINLLMSLDQQNIPFDIVVRHSFPSVVNGQPGFGVQTDSQESNSRVVGVYKNCTISNMSIPINIGTAAVADSGTISVGYVASEEG